MNFTFTNKDNKNWKAVEKVREEVCIKQLQKSKDFVFNDEIDKHALHFIYFDNNGSYGLIEKIAVLERARGQGLCRKIIKEMECEAKNLNLKILLLDSFPNSVDVYKKLSFDLVKESNNDINHSDKKQKCKCLIMAKSLDGEKVDDFSPKQVTEIKEKMNCNKILDFNEILNLKISCINTFSEIATVSFASDKLSLTL